MNLDSENIAPPGTSIRPPTLTKPSPAGLSVTGNTPLSRPSRAPLGAKSSSAGSKSLSTKPSKRTSSSNTSARPKRRALGDITNRSSAAPTSQHPAISNKPRSTTRRRPSAVSRIVPRHPDGSARTPDDTPNHVPIRSTVFEDPVIHLSDVPDLFASTNDSNINATRCFRERSLYDFGRGSQDDTPPTPTTDFDNEAGLALDLDGHADTLSLDIGTSDLLDLHDDLCPDDDLFQLV